MLKKYDHFELTREDVTSYLGRQPSEIEFILIKYFRYSRYLNHPIPELKNIINHHPSPLLETSSGTLIIGSESHHSLTPGTSSHTQHAFGIKPAIKYQSSLSKISIGIGHNVNNQVQEVQGNETLIFIQDGAHFQQCCQTMMALGNIQIHMVYPASLGNVILNILDHKYGLELTMDSVNDISILSEIKIHGILCAVHPESESKMTKVCEEYDLISRTIGQIKTTQFICLSVSNQLKANLPLSSFYPSETTIKSLTPVVGIGQSMAVENLTRELKNYSAHVLTIWNEINRIKIHSLKPEKYSMDTIAFFGENQEMATTIPDNRHFLNNNIYSGSRLLISNAARQLVCKGYKPLGMTMVMHGEDLCKNDQLWLIQEMYMGAMEACQIFGIELINPLITSDNKKADLEICLIGEKVKRFNEIDESFQEENDFITMLGSHRGELNGSIYEKHILKIYNSAVPAIDLGMETRVQEVILQGIQTGLIKSASPVSNGGLVTAIAKSVQRSGDGLGARIHLSRKLRQDEILFGETQGLVVVSIGERDLMEFERICMTIGIPATTIGRVVEDNRLTFNDVVNIPRKDLELKDG